MGKLEEIESGLYDDVKSNEDTPNQLWKKSAPIGKRIPFREFITRFNEQKNSSGGEKEGGFKNMVSTAKTLEDAGYSTITKGETEFSNQVDLIKSGEAFYAPIASQNGNIETTAMSEIQLTDKAVDGAGGDGAATQQTAPSTGSPSMLLFFIFGTAVGIASVIIYNKYKK